MKYSAPLLALALSGCLFGSDPKLEGTWSGSNAGVNYSMTVTENDKTISGSATIIAADASISLTVVGSHVHPTVSLMLSAAGFESFTFAGAFETDDLITGRLNGSGFQNEQISLLRSGR